MPCAWPIEGAPHGTGVRLPLPHAGVICLLTYISRAHSRPALCTGCPLPPLPAPACPCRLNILQPAIREEHTPLPSLCSHLPCLPLPVPAGSTSWSLPSARRAGASAASTARWPLQQVGWAAGGWPAQPTPRTHAQSNPIPTHSPHPSCRPAEREARVRQFQASPSMPIYMHTCICTSTCIWMCTPACTCRS